MLNELYFIFDNLVEKHNMYKVNAYIVYTS
jgi:hypothetical protein